MAKKGSCNTLGKKRPVRIRVDSVFEFETGLTGPQAGALIRILIGIGEIGSSAGIDEKLLPDIVKLVAEWADTAGGSREIVTALRELANECDGLTFGGLEDIVLVPVKD